MFLTEEYSSHQKGDMSDMQQTKGVTLIYRIRIILPGACRTLGYCNNAMLTKSSKGI